MNSEDQDPVDMHEAMIEDWWMDAGEGDRYRDYVKTVFRLAKSEQARQAAEARVLILEGKIRAAHPMGTSEAHTADHVLKELAEDWLKMTMAGPQSPIKFMDGDIERTIVWEEGDCGTGSGYMIEDEHEPYDELKAAKEQAEARLLDLSYKFTNVEQALRLCNGRAEEEARLKEQAEAKLHEAEDRLSRVTSVAWGENGPHEWRIVLTTGNEEHAAILGRMLAEWARADVGSGG